MKNNFYYSIIKRVQKLLEETENTKQEHLKGISNTKLVVIDVYTLRTLLEYATKN